MYYIILFFWVSNIIYVNSNAPTLKNLRHLREFSEFLVGTSWWEKRSGLGKLKEHERKVLLESLLVKAENLKEYKHYELRFFLRYIENIWEDSLSHVWFRKVSDEFYWKGREAGREEGREEVDRVKRERYDDAWEEGSIVGHGEGLQELEAERKEPYDAGKKKRLKELRAECKKAYEDGSEKGYDDRKKKGFKIPEAERKEAYDAGEKKELEQLRAQCDEAYDAGFTKGRTKASQSTNAKIESLKDELAHEQKKVGSLYKKNQDLIWENAQIYGELVTRKNNLTQTEEDLQDSQKKFREKETERATTQAKVENISALLYRQTKECIEKDHELRDMRETTTDLESTIVGYETTQLNLDRTKGDLTRALKRECNLGDMLRVSEENLEATRRMLERTEKGWQKTRTKLKKTQEDLEKTQEQLKTASLLSGNQPNGV